MPVFIYSFIPPIILATLIDCLMLRSNIISGSQSR